VRPDADMTYQPVSEGQIVLRLEFSIADAVHQRGLVSVLVTAIAAWWNRPKMPQNLPANLRADLGLLPHGEPAHWLDLGPAGIPDPLRRPGM
jgi:hypothetical protein